MAFLDQVIGPEQNNLDVYNAVAKDIVHGSIKGKALTFSERNY